MNRAEFVVRSILDAHPWSRRSHFDARRAAMHDASALRSCDPIPARHELKPNPGLTAPPRISGVYRRKPIENCSLTGENTGPTQNKSVALAKAVGARIANVGKLGRPVACCQPDYRAPDRHLAAVAPVNCLVRLTR